MRIIVDSWLDEPRDKILGMRARAPLAVRPHKIGACRYGNYPLYSAAQWRRGHGAWLHSPDIFNVKNLCKKNFAQVLEA